MRQRARSVAAIPASALLAAVLGAGMAGAAPGPNGLIAYSSWDDDGNYDIYVVDPADAVAPPVRLTNDGRYNSNPDWSPDGRRIAYDGWDGAGGPRIRVMDVDPATDDPAVLTAPCADDVSCYGDFQPAWSPDGTRIAFVSSRPSADGSEAWGYQLYVMDALGEVGELADAIRLTTDLPDEWGDMIANSQVTWSPDGTRIAFLSTGRGSGPDSCDLWVMDPQDRDGDGFGDDMQRLTFDESHNCDAFEDVTPQWSPNSSLIAFTSVRSGFFDIWIVNADDPADLRNVTQTPEDYEDQPSWSPDGTQIIFRSSVSGAYELYSLPVPPPATGSKSRRGVPTAQAEPRQLTFDGRNKRQSDWGAKARSVPATRTLSVAKAGNGRVRSAPGGISCGRDCEATLVARSEVRLIAKPGPGARLKRWGGACEGVTGPVCTLSMDKAKRATASFTK